MIATASEPQFPRLCEALDLPELLEDARFASMAERLAHRDALDAAIDAATTRRDIDDLLRILAEHGISAGRVNDLAEGLSTPAALKRGLLAPAPDGGLPAQRTPVAPANAATTRPAPKLGEHGREVLREAGFPDSQIDALTSG